MVRAMPKARATAGTCGARAGSGQAAAVVARGRGMLSGMVPGLIAAVAAATCFETGYALQAPEARQVPRAGALLRRLVARRRWVAGTLLALAGAALQVLALSLAPVVVVQAVLALGLGGLLILARAVLHER